MKLIVVVPVLSLFAIPAAAQESLAQAAERQKKARTGQTKVITADELRSSRSKAYSPTSVDGAAPANPAPTDATAAPAAATKTDAEQRAEKKAEIEEKIKLSTEHVAETRQKMEQAQNELNDLTNITFGGRRDALLKVLEDGAKQIADTEQSIADLREQARRSGIAIAR